MLADQMLARIEYVHEHDFVHRSIKPENFVMGIGSYRNKLFMVDFGSAMKYRYSCKQIHIPYRDYRFRMRTARYMSINAHLGKL